MRFPGTGGSGGSEGKLFTERLDLGRVVVIRPYWDLAEHSCHDTFLQTLSCAGKRHMHALMWIVIKSHFCGKESFP